MLFLIFLVPIAILGAVIACMCWRVKHRQVALAMAAVSLICTGLSLVIILTGFVFYEAL